MLQRVDERYRVRSAFTHGLIWGWVYLKAHIDANVIQLLGHTPGIILNRQGVVRHTIDFMDWTKLLKMTTLSVTVKPKQWVRVCRGMYRGDIGFVISVETWGVEVLLIPRLQSDDVELAPPSKRKRTKIWPQPALLDEVVLKRRFYLQSIDKSEDYITLRGLKFEHGLLRKFFDFASIKSDVLTIPAHHFCLFKFSLHPSLDRCRFLWPQEWIFEEHEKIEIHS